MLSLKQPSKFREGLCCLLKPFDSEEATLLDVCMDHNLGAVPIPSN